MIHICWINLVIQINILFGVIYLLIYSFRSSTRDEVKIEEIEENGCSNMAIVTAVTQSSTRQTAIILARNIGNNI